MTILIDTKNEMKRSIDGVASQVVDLERDLRAAFNTEIADLRDAALTDLKSSQQETRTSAYNAGKRASEAVTAVAELRRDVDQLHHGLGRLREDVGKILEVLQSAAPPSLSDDLPGHSGGEQAVLGGSLGPAPSTLPGQAHPLQGEPSPRADGTATVSAPPPADTSALPEEQPMTAAEDEVAQPTSEAEGQGAAEVDDKSQHQELLRATLDTGSEVSGEPVKEPEPLTWAGRIWAVLRAGNVASATLICHRDTWEFVAAQVGSHPHFRTPALEEREDGLVAAVLSGRSVVAMLLALYRVAETSRKTADGADTELAAYADWAMASQVYSATARVLGRAYSQEGDPVVVTIDSRVPAQV